MGCAPHAPCDPEMNALVEHRPAILVIFILTYVGMAVGRVPGLKLNRTGIALLGAIAMIVVSGSTSTQAAECVNWPTILLLFGFFVISAQLRLSGFYGWVAEWISGRLEAPSRFLAFVIVMTAVLSAFLNNDIVCFVVTPVVGVALLHKGIDPVPCLVAVALASNVGAAATLIGNAQNILIGEVAGLSFARYMLWSFVPVCFGLAVVYVVARSRLAPGSPVPAAPLVPVIARPYPFNRAHVAKGLVILATVIVLFFTSLPKEIVVLVAAGVHLASARYRTESILALIDWQILVLFTALFIVSGTFQKTGYGEEIVAWLEGAGFGPTRPANLVAITAGLSALINNAPAVMLLLKIVPVVKASTGYIMAVANSFAGSIIMTAAVSNLIVVQQARQHGIAISFRDFARISVPVTIVALCGLIGWAELMGP
jgi:Na+/H+ antiporter NhaD/arsenite permease-like protein